jgi:hypothetical protein
MSKRPLIESLDDTESHKEVKQIEYHYLGKEYNRNYTLYYNDIAIVVHDSILVNASTWFANTIERQQGAEKQMTLPSPICHASSQQLLTFLGFLYNPTISSMNIRHVMLHLELAVYFEAGYLIKSFEKELLQQMTCNTTLLCRVGSYIDAKDSQGQWCPAQVIDEMQNGAIHVHYIGWADRWNETIAEADIRTRTRQFNTSPYSTRNHYKEKRIYPGTDSRLQADENLISLLLLGDKLNCPAIFNHGLNAIRKCAQSTMAWEPIVLHGLIKELSKPGLQSLVFELLAKADYHYYGWRDTFNSLTSVKDDPEEKKEP